MVTTPRDLVDRPLNVLLYSNSFLPHVGGREIVVYHLAKALVESGHKARVISHGGWWRLRNEVYPFTVQRLPRIPGMSEVMSARLMLSYNLARYGGDIVHAHATYPVGYIALLNKAFTQVPLVITPHGDDIHVIPEIGHGLRLNPDYNKKIQRVVNNAEYLTAISDSVVSSLLDATAPAESIVEIPNGVDFTRFASNKTIDVRSHYQIPENKRIVLTVGNYVRRRGHEELVQAVPSFIANHPEAHLVIVGRGTEVLQPMIDDLGIAESVTLTGAIPPIEINHLADDVVGAFYRECEVYVAPGMSEGSEGLSLALLDAMASGSAIVATRISGNRDVINDGENGVLVAPGEPEALASGISQVLSSGQLAERICDQALQDVQPYSWAAIAEQYVETYRDAIRKGRELRRAAA